MLPIGYDAESTTTNVKDGNPFYLWTAKIASDVQKMMANPVGGFGDE